MVFKKKEDTQVICVVSSFFDRLHSKIKFLMTKRKKMPKQSTVFRPASLGVHATVSVGGKPTKPLAWAPTLKGRKTVIHPTIGTPKIHPAIGTLETLVHWITSLPEASLSNGGRYYVHYNITIVTNASL